MRTLAPAFVAAVVSFTEPEMGVRYLVIPTAHEAHAGAPCRPALSADGRIVAFEAITALDPADRNGTTDVYVLDRTSRRLTLESRTPSGVAGRGASRCPSLSADGRRLTFLSDAADLVGDGRHGTPGVVFVDLETGTRRWLSDRQDAELWILSATISGDGRVAVFEGRVFEGSAGPPHVLRSTLDAGTPPEDLGEGFAPAVNHDGRVIAYRVLTRSGGRAGLFVLRGGVRHEVARVASGVADAVAEAAVLSGDGQWIAFQSRATNLMPGRRLSGRSHVYLEHVADGRRSLVSATPEGVEGNGHSGRPVVDHAATRVVFQSTATNLPCGRPRRECGDDINLVSDIFLWTRDTGAVGRVNVPTQGLPWLGVSTAPMVSADGRVVAFFSCQPFSEADDRRTFDLFITGS